MSPEQVSAKEVTEASDIYSLGCVMFETICGYPPFMGTSVAKTMVMHKTEPAPPVENTFHGREVPDQLAYLISACLQKAVIDRPSGLSTIKMNLKEILEEELEKESEESIVESEEVLPLRSYFKLVAIPKVSLGAKIVLGVLLIGITCGAYFIQSNVQKPTKEVSKKAFTEEIFDPEKVSLEENLDIRFNRELKYSPDSKMFLGSDCTDDQELRKLAHTDKYFEKLNLEDALIEGDSLEVLVDKPIVYIDFKQCLSLKDKALKILSKCQTLQNLNLEECVSLTNKGYAYLPKLKNLKSLTFKSKNVNDETAKYVSNIPTLEWLRIEQPSTLTDRGFSYLTKLKNLYLLEIVGTQITRKSFSKLSAFPKLTILTLASSKLEDQDMKLVCMPKLSSINISKNPAITPKGFKELRRLKKIDLIYLEKTNFDDSNVPDLVALKPFFIDIAHTKVTALGLETISKLKGVTYLNISGLNLTDRDIKCLRNMKELEILDVSFNNLTNHAMTLFARIKTLKKIEVKAGTNAIENESDNPKITSDGIKYFVQRLPNCKLR